VTGTPARGTPARGTPARGTPAGSTPAGSTPAGSTPAGSTPAGSTAAGSTAGGGTAGGGTASGSDLRADADLLAAHVDGDPTAFAELFRRHRTRLWAVALRTLGDPEEAADALQEAMVSAFRRAGGFRGEAAVTTWLHRIVVNACLDRVRRRRPVEALPESDGGDRPDSARLGVPDGAETSATAMDVAAALASLPPEQRAAIVLVDLEGYPVAEAADLLGVPVGTVKSRCSRGRVRLVPLLGHLVGRSQTASDSAPTGAGPDPAPVRASGGHGTRGRVPDVPPTTRTTDDDDQEVPR